MFGGLALVAAVLMYYLSTYVPDLRYTYTGTVLDIAGNPIEGVAINFFSEGWKDEKTITDLDGSFFCEQI